MTAIEKVKAATKKIEAAKRAVAKVDENRAKAIAAVNEKFDGKVKAAEDALATAKAEFDTAAYELKNGPTEAEAEVAATSEEPVRDFGAEMPEA